ncbi:hypothetical protein TWF225_008949 [Orbilia oligospora]|uniref:Uncharacterized protein n=1 Tax=Orbilia oligospora TaxID=2813651 RepID=A0A7C8KEQ0_ORBOL|nr:hypothetical protein TWF751_009007 [Orbilia oligospora]KAF3175446.1 hypothetical protein TWF225_008949 [Orbilia oligospora]KAF3252014.1 hypothetical protein TWF128_006849 [Orbilia oligospora]KAF3264778.1 hypothetical protein TWF217_002962 [Orbilia oligospora]TGJ73340.1 hypothetical protein EYR41_000446 [Orbilia oligospora]
MFQVDGAKERKKNLFLALYAKRWVEDPRFNGERGLDFSVPSCFLSYVLPFGLKCMITKSPSACDHFPTLKNYIRLLDDIISGIRDLRYPISINSTKHCSNCILNPTIADISIRI